MKCFIFLDGVIIPFEKVRLICPVDINCQDNPAPPNVTKAVRVTLSDTVQVNLVDNDRLDEATAFVNAYVEWAKK